MFYIFKCELNESKPFYKLDTELQMVIRERNPKLQSDERSSVLSQRDDGKSIKENSDDVCFSVRCQSTCLFTIISW